MWNRMTEWNIARAELAAAERRVWAVAEELDPQLSDLWRSMRQLLSEAVAYLTGTGVTHELLVRRQAAVQASNTLRAAWLLLGAGFEVQALALARLVGEYLTVIWYVHVHPEAADIWLQTSIRPPSAGELRDRLDRENAPLPELARLLPLSRDLLNRLAHQDPLALAFAYRLAEGEAGFYRQGPYLDTLALRRGGEFLVPLTLLALETIDQMFSPGDDWQRRMQKLADRAEEWFDRDAQG